MPPKKKTTKSSGAKKTNSKKSTSQYNQKTLLYVLIGLVIAAIVVLLAIMFYQYTTVSQLNSDNAVLQDELQKIKDGVSGIQDKVTDLEKEKEQNQQQQEFEQKMARLTSLDCSTYGETWRSYLVNRFSFAFCYNSEWGTPTSQDNSEDVETAQGEHWTLRFGDEPEEVSEDIFITVYSNDFKRSDVATDGPFFDPGSFDLTQSEEALAQDIENAVSVTKITIDDVLGIRVRYPEAYENYAFQDTLKDNGYDLLVFAQDPLLEEGSTLVNSMVIVE